jgi:hypothetical protein
MKVYVLYLDQTHLDDEFYEQFKIIDVFMNKDKAECKQKLHKNTHIKEKNIIE